MSNFSQNSVKEFQQTSFHSALRLKFKKKIVFILLGSILTILLGFLAFIFLFTYTVSGKIIDISSKKPIEGVKVSIAGIQSETNSQGNYQIKGIKIFQKKNLEISVPEGYEEVSNIEVDYKKRKIRKDISLEPKLITIINRLLPLWREVRYDETWYLMHPDDQIYWGGVEEMQNALSEREKWAKLVGYGKVLCSVTDDVKQLDNWKSPVTNKEYKEVIAVPVLCKFENREETQSNIYFQRVDGFYRFFTSMSKEEVQELTDYYKSLNDPVLRQIKDSMKNLQSVHIESRGKSFILTTSGELPGENYHVVAYLDIKNGRLYEEEISENKLEPALTRVIVGNEICTSADYYPQKKWLCSQDDDLQIFTWTYMLRGFEKIIEDLGIEQVNGRKLKHYKVKTKGTPDIRNAEYYIRGAFSEEDYQDNKEGKDERIKSNRERAENDWKSFDIGEGMSIRTKVVHANEKTLLVVNGKDIGDKIVFLINNEQHSVKVPRSISKPISFALIKRVYNFLTIDIIAAEADVWVDEESNYIYKEIISSEQAHLFYHPDKKEKETDDLEGLEHVYKTSVEINFSRFNEDFDISLPPENKRISSEDLYKEKDNKSELREDSKRISDIKQIQTALELYFVDNNKYPDNKPIVVIGESDIICLGKRGWGQSNCQKPYLKNIPHTSGLPYIYILDGRDNYYILFTLENDAGGLQAGLNAAYAGGIKNIAEYQDSDQDELPDEIEEIIGTDIGNSDSDNDGYMDGIEVKRGYNPLGQGRLK